MNVIASLDPADDNGVAVKVCFPEEREDVFAIVRSIRAAVAIWPLAVREALTFDICVIYFNSP